jgi:hypothetical protein
MGLSHHLTNACVSHISRRVREALRESAKDEQTRSKDSLAPITGTPDLDMWLSDTSGCGPDDPLAPAVLDEQPDGLLSTMVTVLDTEEYRQTAFGSVAYKWLVSSLEREIRLSCVGESAPILTPQTLGLPTDDQYAHNIEFRVDWELGEFLKTQYGSLKNPKHSLARAIALTGSACDAQALPCSEYLNQTWPMSGPRVLAAVCETLQTGSHAAGKKNLETLTPLI